MNSVLPQDIAQEASHNPLYCAKTWNNSWHDFTIPLYRVSRKTGWIHIQFHEWGSGKCCSFSGQAHLF